jgi:hypothetical protein
MRRVFKTRHFHRWLRKTELSDAALCSAISEMANGLIDADLGGGIMTGPQLDLAAMDGALLEICHDHAT